MGNYLITLFSEKINIVKWKVIVFIISGCAGSIISILVVCVIKLFMKRRNWRLRRQRTRHLHRRHERFVLNPLSLVPEEASV